MSDHDESAAFLADLARQELIDAVNDEARIYQATGNGLCAWRAFRLCREAGEPVPEVLLSYFDHVGRALERADNPQEVARAVQIEARGRISPQRHLRQADKAFSIASQVDLLRSLPRPVGLNDACRRVAARRGMTYGAVKKAYREWQTRERPASQRKAQAPANSVFTWGR